MPVIEIPTDEITDWESFHDVFAAVLGFPDFYGRNMNAWIDCLTYADEDDGMRSFTVEPADILTLRLSNATAFAARCPEQYDALVECSAFVNWRRIEPGGQPMRPILALAFWKEAR